VRDIDVGGLTPSMDLVRSLASETPLPLRVMVRENAGYGVTDARELDALRRAVDTLAALRVDGAVAGFLRGGEPDIGTLATVLGAGPGLKVTFHRAFDELADPIGAIRTLGSVPQIDRILTAGTGGIAARLPAGSLQPPAIQESGASARCRCLQALSEVAGTRLTILAGGGIGEEELEALRSSGAVREAHVGRAARENGIAGAPVSAERVRRLRRIADGR
jgi:copper homeostasis protein